MDTSYVYEYVHVYADLDMYMKGLNQGQVVRAFVGCVGCVDVGFGVGVFVAMGNLLVWIKYVVRGFKFCF